MRRVRWGMGTSTLVAAVAVATSTVGPHAAVAADPPPLQVLSPGLVGFAAEELPLNVVLVGYEDDGGPRGVPADQLLAGQPQLTLPVARLPLLLGRILPTYTAIFPQFRVTYADQPFEDDFFGHLAAIGEPAPVTDWQAAYNAQPQRSQTVADQLEIDAPSVEEWLGDHAAKLGVDVSEPTVFFVNWFGRPDFRFHTYTRIGKPDIDTGVDSGHFPSRRIIAWGGTPRPGDARRIWFHDLSAGPEFNTEHYDITTADVDGDGLLDYRMPPVWEYGNDAGYRPFDDLAGDLGLILRYVFFDLLVAPSPLYSPTISPPQIPDQLGVDITRIRAPGHGPTPIDHEFVAEAHAKLQPWASMGLDERSIPYDGEIQRVTRCWITGWLDPTGVGDTCFGRSEGGFAFYDLMVFLLKRWNQFVWSPAEHSVPVLLYEVPVEERHPFLAGAAEPNFRTGEQFDIVLFHTPASDAGGHGQTDTLVHELGHYVGLSHPHDGLDYEGGFNFDASGPFFFAWAGDESATVMSYLDLENGFSQFERDSIGRWMVAAFLNQANQVLAQIVASPQSARVNADLVAADNFALQALLAFDGRSYAEAAASAERAYDTVVAAAERLHIAIEPQAQPADRKGMGRSDMFVDPIPPIPNGRPETPGPAVHPVDLQGLTPFPMYGE